MNFNRCDRTLKWECGYWGGTLKRWYKEGLPQRVEYKRNYDYGEFINGPGLHYPMPNYGDSENHFSTLFAEDVSLYFDFDKSNTPFPINWFYNPFFEEIIINESDDKLETIDNFGIKSIKFKDNRSMPQWIEHPIKSISDWEEIKRDRLRLDDLNKRYTIKNINSFISKAKNRDFPLILFGDPIGFFGILRFMIGEENLYFWYYDKPSLLKDILNHLCSLWLNIAEEIISKIDFDFCYFFEDMAYKQGSLISPAIFKEFMAPYYKKLINFSKSKGLKHYIVDSDGYIEDLIPLFLEVGINGILPMEVRAGNDVERIRENYPTLIIIGGVDKTVLSNIKKVDIELEKVRRMIKKGGYIPYADHAIIPDVSWDNFKYYRENLNFIIDTTKIMPDKITR